MEYGVISIMTLGVVILIVSFLSHLDKKKNKEDEEAPSKIEENREKEDINEVDHGTEETYVLEPQTSFMNYLHAFFYDDDYTLDFFCTYKKLSEKASEIESSKDRMVYLDLVSCFFNECMKHEKVEPSKLFDNSNYGEINVEKLEILRGLNVLLLQSVIKSAESAIAKKQYVRILKIDLEFIYLAMQYYSFIQPDQHEFLRAKRVADTLSKRLKIQKNICDIYMAHLGNQHKELVELVERCLDSKLITEKDFYELASALKWMDELDEEKRVLLRLKTLKEVKKWEN